MASAQTSNLQSLLRPGETLGQPVSGDVSSLLKPGETLGQPVIDSSDTQQPPALGDRVLNAAVDEGKNIARGVVAPIKAAASEPEDATEHVVSGVAGQGGLVAYRLSKAIVDAVENVVKAKKEDFRNAAVDEMPYGSSTIAITGMH